MNEKELRELDAWIAEHVMGWCWHCALGKAYLFPPWSFDQLDSFSVHWTKGVHEKGWTRTEPEKKSCKKVFNPVSIHGNSNEIEIPHFTTDPAAAMAVLERCATEHHWPSFTPITRNINSIKWIYTNPKTLENKTVETLPLAICLFAKQLFSK